MGQFNHPNVIRILGLVCFHEMVSIYNVKNVLVLCIIYQSAFWWLFLHMLHYTHKQILTSSNKHNAWFILHILAPLDFDKSLFVKSYSLIF